jgi:hypothetical protein
MDVGVDSNNFFPLSFDEIAAIMEERAKTLDLKQGFDYHARIELGGRK